MQGERLKGMHAWHIHQCWHTLHRWEEHGRSENAHHGQQMPPRSTLTHKDRHFGNISVVLLGDFSSCHQSGILRYSRQIPLILEDMPAFDNAITFTELVRHQDADFRAQLTHLSEGVFTKKTGGDGCVDTSTCFPQQRRQSSWTMPSLHLLRKKIW